MPDFDVYETTRLLISRLHSDGYAEDAANLRSAMENGATGGEIFMALRPHVADIVRRVPLPADWLIRASRLLAEIDWALR